VLGRDLDSCRQSRSQAFDWLRIPFTHYDWLSVSCSSFDWIVSLGSDCDGCIHLSIGSVCSEQRMLFENGLVYDSE